MRSCKIDIRNVDISSVEEFIRSKFVPFSLRSRSWPQKYMFLDRIISTTSQFPLESWIKSLGFSLEGSTAAWMLLWYGWLESYPQSNDVSNCCHGRYPLHQTCIYYHVFKPCIEKAQDSCLSNISAYHALYSKYVDPPLVQSDCENCHRQNLGVALLSKASKKSGKCSWWEGADIPIHS